MTAFGSALASALGSAVPSELAMQSILQPASAAASRLANLGWYLIAMTIAVALFVFALLLLGMRRRGRGSVEDPPEIELPDRAVRMWVLIGGAAFPAIVLALTLVIVIITLAGAGSEAEAEPADIELIGHQWWWEVRYPGLGVAEANEIHVPVGRPVRVAVRTADVIHSLWVPQLHGKLDLIPGKRNEIVLHADREDVFRGACAEYCGMQHAHMELYVVAHDSAGYAEWVQSRRMPARQPADAEAARGAAVFAANGCAFCHTVRGTPARGGIGPDLTHVGSRRTIAAGLLPATRASFAGWIANPHVLKSGTLMPAFALPGRDLRAVAAYLESLQ